jgi:hypothetical protein
MQSYFSKDMFCTCVPKVSSPIGNSVDRKYISIFSSDIILFTGIAIVIDNFTLPSKNTSISGNFSLEDIKRTRM